MKKLFAVVYGVLSYVLFFGALLYLMAFVANLVPQPISGAPRLPGVAAAVIDLGLVTLFSLQHSIMARSGFKRWLTAFVPPHLERSTYVLASTVFLGAVVLGWQPIGGVVWNLSGTPALILTAISASGWALLLFSTFLTDHFALFGLRQVFTYAAGRTPTPVVFRERGTYRVVRHPMMLGFLIAFWAASLMTVGHLLFAGLMTAYILVGIYFEERSLMSAHGRAYAGYRERVPMLLPGLRSARAEQQPAPSHEVVAS